MQLVRNDFCERKEMYEKLWRRGRKWDLMEETK